jgi:hypothetical protein
MTSKKTSTALIVVGSIAALALISSNSGPSQGTFLASTQSVFDQAFAQFVATHNRMFATVQEFNARKANFVSNMQLIMANDPTSGV